MGTDNLFHKRRAKGSRDLERQRARREQYAHELYQVEKAKGDPFDRVYCVFDKDTHVTYQAALNKVAGVKRPQNTFFAINSVPCFEYWLLLHFIYTTAPFNATGGTSACDGLINRLRGYLPSYTKASHGVFTELIDYLDTAKTNAVRSLAEAERTGTDNPTTRVHELVAYLQNIKTNTELIE